MKKMVFFFALMFLSSAFLNAAPFSPSLLRLSAPQRIQYDFDGKNLEIPVTLSGSPGGVFFLLYTKDKAAAINKVQNGFLGWHYVNKIDTCVYASPLYSLAQGSNKINWDGKGDGGALVPAGSYTYYLWAYDNVGSGIPISTQPDIDFRATGNMGIVQETGQDGAALANPVFYTGIRVASGVYTINKWVIGNDPEDHTLKESTSFKPTGTVVFSGGVIALHPDNHSIFYWQFGNRDIRTQYLEKRTWVPNGESQAVTGWVDNGRIAIPNAYEESEPGVIADGKGHLITGDGNRKIWTEPDSDVYVFDINTGEQIKYFDMTEWWSSAEDFKAGGQMNGGPDTGFVMRGGFLFLSGGDSCIKQMVDPYADNTDDFYRWTNQNGDYTFDWNFDPSAQKPWVCRDLNVAPYNFNWTVDANFFSMGSAYDLGAVTWGLLAPDGTGLGYITVANETAAWKWGALFVDSNSAYDGIYKDNSNNVRTAGIHLLNFLGHDSIKGEIGNQISVRESAPEAFTVAQNSPNPFNPVTTISFTLAGAGKTTVEVFNAAGQKVDVVLIAHLNAGSHSVSWDGSNHAAGVYFYSVRSGSFSKTMKMTLLK